MDYRDTSMWKEINETPAIFGRIIGANADTMKKLVAEIKAGKSNNFVAAARGASDHALIFFKYALEVNSNYTCGLSAPSVITLYKGKINYSNSIVIGCSRSGKAADVLEVIKKGNDQGAITIAVTNDTESPIAKEAKFHLFCAAGAENSVAATKTMAAEVLVLGLLVLGLADKYDQIPALEKIPDKLASLATRYDEIKDLARKISHQKNVIILTRGPMQGIGREVALKYKECCYVMSHFYSVSDFMHGPLAIVEEGSSVLMLAPNDECVRDYIEMATRLSLLGATVTAITDTNEVSCVSNYSFVMPEREDMITDAVLYAFVGHILCYEIAFDKGLNPDVPRNLKKVTITK